MNGVPSFVWPFVAMLINLVWSALNMRSLAGLKDEVRKEFVTRAECGLNHRICEDRHSELCRRLDNIERRGSTRAA